MSPRRVRVPAGVRGGGQFAAHPHADPQVGLGGHPDTDDPPPARVLTRPGRRDPSETTVQVRAAVAAARTVRDRHPDAATIDLDLLDGRLVPVAVRDRFGDPLPATAEPGAPWERPIDLDAVAGHTGALRPDQLAELGWARRAPDYRGVAWMLDVDEVLGTAPF